MSAIRPYKNGVVLSRRPDSTFRVTRKTLCLIGLKGMQTIRATRVGISL